ncbi:MAG: hypothetical protein HQM08_16555 [Candidatus Riflebacteria bacterium]|nr:hypothetical protein [Candidatus Riflebacteria bacterium]
MTSKYPYHKYGFTITEILISLAIATLALILISVIVTRSQVVYRLGTEHMETQTLLEDSLSVLTADFKAMTRFIGIKNGKEIEFETSGNHGVELVKYTFDETEKSLKRISNKSFSTDFKSRGRIDYLSFSAIFTSETTSDRWSDHVNLVMHLISTENDKMQSKVKLPVIVQFYSGRFVPNKFGR